MNPGVTWLVSFLILLVILILAVLSYAIYTYYSNNPNSNNGVNLPPCSEVTNISSLVQIGDLPECIVNGVSLNRYYIGRITDGKYNFTVSPYKNQPLDVCISFCSKYDGKICTGPEYNGKTAQENFESCMEQLSSTVCKPPIPIAAKGTILYYPLQPKCECENCTSM